MIIYVLVGVVDDWISVGTKLKASGSFTSMGSFARSTASPAVCESATVPVLLLSPTPRLVCISHLLPAWSLLTTGRYALAFVGHFGSRAVVSLA